MMSRVSLQVMSFIWRTVERSFSLVNVFLKIKRSQPSAAPTEISVGAAEGCDLLTVTRPKRIHGVSSRVLRIRPFCEPYAVAFQTLPAAQAAQFSADRRRRDHSVRRRRVPSLPAGENRPGDPAHLYRRAVPATGRSRPGNPRCLACRQTG